jgi:hypothetical protein
MLRTGGTVAILVGAMFTAGTMNLAVLNEGPSGPGNLVLRAASGTTTTTAQHSSHRVAAGTTTSTSTPGKHGHVLTRANSTTTSTDATTTTTAKPPSHQPGTTTTTRPPTTTTTTATSPDGGRLFNVRNAGHVRVHWVNGRTISATAEPNHGWSLPHSTKQGPNVTLRFQSKTQLVVWHAWVEAHQIKAWIHTYQL